VQKFQVDAGTWAVLNRLLDEALEQPAPQLPQWLNDLAPEFDALKPRLRELLSRTGLIETDEFLRTLPKLDLDQGDLAAEPTRADQPGQEIGPYRLVRELGSGGMGVVWLAARTDGLINRPVALKLPHGAWKRAGLAERMAREREILATLTHPNIAHLYDAGVTADGQPFLAIEYIEGRRIDSYCNEQQLGVEARLRLFSQVAGAVAHAHGKLVVHRDLKPANILVNGEGQVRLLDFGIAKLLDDGQAKETRFTEVSGRALTPDYASPEQILGEPLTIASDVYSLGVVLYELVAGQQPYKLQRDSRGALEDAILQADPAAPSQVAHASWRKSLRGDLDTIVLKALKKVPAERYSTVHALLDDIARYLDGRPVSARPDSRWYRVRKFAARNRIAVSATGAIFLAVLTGSGIAAWQARVALAEKVRAEQVQEFIAAVFREADPYQGAGKVVTAVELLRQAELRLHERSDADPAMQLELLAIIGESLFGLQENAEAARVTEQALRLPASRAEENALLSARLHLTLSHAYELLGRSEDARAQAERSLARLTAAGHAATPIYARAKLQQSALGIVLADYEVAERAAHEAINVASAALGNKSTEVAKGLNQLSHVYTLTQRHERAVGPARQALDILLELHARNLNHPAVIEAGQYYGQALDSTGRFDEAFIVYRDATARAGSVFGVDSRAYGEMLNSSVTLEIEVGDLKSAVSHARRMIEIYLLEGEPGSVTHVNRMRQLGNALLASRASTEAAERLDEALRLAVAANSTLQVRHARGSLGLALAYLGRFDRADRELMQAIGTPGKEVSGGQLLAMQNLGTSLRLQGRYAESQPWLERAMAAASIKPGRRGYLAHALLDAGLVKLELGDPAAANVLFERADPLFKDVQREHMTPARADLFVGMARVRMQRKEFAAALQLLWKADGIWREFDPDNRWAGETALWLGRCQWELGQRAEASETLARATRLLTASPLPVDMSLVKLARIRD
jgi:serine/threonine protein kinase/Tfp pilus assembly protein PilF